MQVQKTLLSWFSSSSEVVISSQAVPPHLAVYTFLDINFQQDESVKASISVSTMGELTDLGVQLTPDLLAHRQADEIYD